MKHPIQPTEVDAGGVIRFKANTLVRYLLDNGGINLNDLAAVACDADDRQHFAQLIGYSVSGYSDLNYCSAGVAAAASAPAGKDISERRIEYLESVITDTRNRMREAVAELYNIHPDDLHGGAL